MKEFIYEKFLPRELYNEINRIRTFEPWVVKKEAENRRKPIQRGERYVFAAADHNARMINEYKGDKIGLGNRHEYLARLARMLQSSEVDGVEAAPDVIEDLLILNYLTRRRTGSDFMADKLIVGTVNRGGLKNTAWEMDDMCTCFTVERINKLKLDGVKFMIRINPDSELSKNTVRYCAQIVNEAEKYGLPVFIESLFVRNDGSGYKMQTDTESLVKTVGVVSALGCTALQKWLEVPINGEYQTVTDATTCSILVVPDELMHHPEDVVEEYTEQIGANFNVRGILLGRNVMFNESDPYYIAEAVARIWHGKCSRADAYKEVLGSLIPDSL